MCAELTPRLVVLKKGSLKIVDKLVLKPFSLKPQFRDMQISTADRLISLTFKKFMAFLISQYLLKN